MMLLLFLFGLRDEKWLYFFSFVVGTQMGCLFTTMELSIRTSHFTGCLTDNGVVLGRWCAVRLRIVGKVLFLFYEHAIFGIGVTVSYQLFQSLWGSNNHRCRYWIYSRWIVLFWVSVKHFYINGRENMKALVVVDMQNEFCRWVRWLKSRSHYRPCRWGHRKFRWKGILYTWYS